MKKFKACLEKSTTAPSPEIACRMPETDSLGIGLIIFPGGGYGQLAAHEGEGYATAFSNSGITCFVVNYRLGSSGHHHPAMLEDAWAAITTIRTRCDEFGIEPDKIGVMGSSAGGHLAAHSMIGWPDYHGKTSARPDFGVLCYPVISAMGPFAHKGSILNLLGENPLPEMLDKVSCERHVTAQTPPCFIWHTFEDAGVPIENSMMFATALRKHNVPFELHIYQEGRHGLGLNTTFDWAAECLRWIRKITNTR